MNGNANIKEQCRLEAQLQLAISADHRALALAGINATLCAAAVAAAAAFHQQAVELPVIYALFGFAFFALIAAAIATIGALPAKIRAPGIDPKVWCEEEHGRLPDLDQLHERVLLTYVRAVKDNGETQVVRQNFVAASSTVMFFNTVVFGLTILVVLIFL